jgi:asparagine N-glycosylation enzyme membrane subunit Stt3
MILRKVAAAAVLVSVAIHGWLWYDGMRDVHVIGPAFLVNVVSGIVIAVLLVRWRHWLPAALAACFGLATLGAFTLASTIGLFGTHEKWQGAYVLGAAGAEIVAIVLGLALVLEDPDPSPAPAHRHRAQVPLDASANRSDSA